MVMKGAALSTLWAAVLGIAVAALQCNSILSSDAPSAEPCDANCDLCTTYCNAIMQACPAGGPNVEYLTTDVCMAACSFSSADWITNQLSNDTTTLACRQASADNAESGTLSCANAGPLGGASCETTTDRCMTFCQLEVSVCADNVQYEGGVSDCTSYCAGLPYVLPGSGGDLAPHEMGDNTLNCRFYHLENAMKPGAGFGPQTHCPHTGKTGGGVCTSSDAGAEAAGDNAPAQDAGAEEDTARE
jgi:hypothetical protein